MNTFFLKIPLVVLLLIVSFSTVAQAQYDDTFVTENLRSGVRKIKTEWNIYHEVDHKVILSLDEDWLLVSEVEYDENYNIISRYRRMCSQSVDPRKREVISNNLQIVEFIYGKADNLEEKFIHQKDKDKRVIQTDHFDQNGILLDTWHYSYETDNQGNWIRRESVWNLYNVPDERHFIFKTVERRTISYF